MRNEVSISVTKAENEFKKLEDYQKLYYISVLLNHLYNGLINDGNYLSEDEAFENDADVLLAESINLDDPVKLATNLLVIGAKLENKTINPNGIDIEPYISDVDKLGLNNFYNLNYKDKIDFLMNTIYIISEIDALISLSVCSEEYNFVRPTLNEDGLLETYDVNYLYQNIYF